MNVEVADISDVKEIHFLINNSYREIPSWTQESSLVSGTRISELSLVNTLKSEETTILVLKEDEKILGSICLTYESDASVSFSLFAITPETQNQGLGSRLLASAENFAVDKLGAKKLIVKILSLQQELNEYYLRRNYRESGIKHPYPIGHNVGVPLVEGLFIKQLEKSA